MPGPSKKLDYLVSLSNHYKKEKYVFISKCKKYPEIYCLIDLCEY